jgi:N-acetylglucosamine-6-phosphate deacetylase
MMADRKLVAGGHIMCPEEEWPVGWILVEDGRIIGMKAGEAPRLNDVEVIDARGHYVVPGFIDMHAHGAVGHRAIDGEAESLRMIAQYYAQHGTTAFLPTLETASAERIMFALETIADMVGQPTGGAAILGAHLEGPYFNPAKCGVQDTRYIRRADRAEATAFMDTGVVRLIALAPEYQDNHWLIEEAARRGIVVSAGHTEAGPEDIEKAVRLGLRQSTHTFNAMVGLHHRNPGTVGAVMANRAITCELIADGHHVHPITMDILIRAKGLDRVILITDAVSQAGLPDGTYDQDGMTVVVRQDRIQLPDGTLAGAACMLDHNLRQIMYAAKLSLREAWPLTSLNAATQLRIADRKGKLAEGYDGDMVLLDEHYHVTLTMVNGRTVFKA